MSLFLKEAHSRVLPGAGHLSQEGCRGTVRCKAGIPKGWILVGEQWGDVAQSPHLDSGPQMFSGKHLSHGGRNQLPIAISMGEHQGRAPTLVLKSNSPHCGAHPPPTLMEPEGMGSPNQ